VGFFVAALTCAGTISAVLAVYYWQLGNNNIILDTASAKDFVIKYHLPSREIYCSCSIPLSNRGEQQGMVNNIFCQPVYCGEIMKELEIISAIHLMQKNSTENQYWESLILKKNDCYLTKLEVKIRSLIELPLVIKELPQLTILIYYQIVGRKRIEWKLAEVSFNLTRETSSLLGNKTNRGEEI